MQVRWVKKIWQLQVNKIKKILLKHNMEAFNKTLPSLLGILTLFSVGTIDFQFWKTTPDFTSAFSITSLNFQLREVKEKFILKELLIQDYCFREDFLPPGF